MTNNKITRKMLQTFIVCSFFLIAATQAAEPSEESFRAWSTFYYQDPRPADTPLMLHYMSKKGILARSNSAPAVSGLLLELFTNNPQQVTSWLSDLESYAPDEQRPLVLALWMSNTPESKELLRSFGQSKVKALFGRDLGAAPPQPVEVEIHQPGDLDFYWGAFLRPVILDMSRRSYPFFTLSRPKGSCRTEKSTRRRS